VRWWGHWFSNFIVIPVRTSHSLALAQPHNSMDEIEQRYFPVKRLRNLIITKHLDGCRQHGLLVYHEMLLSDIQQVLTDVFGRAPPYLSGSCGHLFL
jgi:hypothetical protein